MSWKVLGALSIAALAMSAAHAADATRGKSLFKNRCLLCHTAEAADDGGAQGPSLIGVLGRPAASAQFPYSQALLKSNLTWDAQTLDKFLTSPTALVPGTSMPISTPSDKDRADLLAYFSSLKGESGSAAAASASSPSAAGAKGVSGDWDKSAPGSKRHIQVSDLPKPYDTPSARNNSRIVDRPANAKLAVPQGFTVKTFVDGLNGPRVVRIAPNGDIFVAETGAGQVRVLRAAEGQESPSQSKVFATGLDHPFGIGFYPLGSKPQWIYIAGENSVVRIPYQSGDLEARGQPETIVAQLAGTSAGHTTRDLVFSNDGQRMFVSVGSASNVAEREARKSAEDVKRWDAEHGLGAAWGDETNRADVLVFEPTGKKPSKVFAAGIRNCVGLTVHPTAGDVWCVTNERDGLGDDLVPDYATRVKEGAFYGWPWYYLGSIEDPRHKGERPDLAGKVTVPDVLFQAHSAALQIAFYNSTGKAAFPAKYRGGAFVSLHGSWNRAKRTGYKVVYLPMQKNGVPTGEYEDFMTGFVVDDASVWGRPVGVAVARDGALLIADDGSNQIFRVTYSGP